MINSIEYKGYTIRQSQGAGAAVKGTKKTATIQVHKRLGTGTQMIYQTAFKVDCPPCVEDAVKRAKVYVDKTTDALTEFERCRDDVGYFVQKYCTVPPRQSVAPSIPKELGRKDQLERMYSRLPLWMRMDTQLVKKP